MSYEPNSLLEVARYTMESLAFVDETDDGVRITTNCMYPSNGLVSVVLRGGRETFVVSDEGAGVGEAASGGVQLDNPDKQLRHLVSPQGLAMKGGIIFSDPVTLDRLPVAILAVANASQEVAHWLYQHMKIKRAYDFKKLLSSFLQNTFEQKLHHQEVFIGASNTPRRFENVVFLENNRRLIVDPVINDPSSINARVMANLDIREAHYPNIEQRIIYDDAEEWSPADINVLNFGATVVGFSKARDVIMRVARVA
jgi:hypothetical protein